MSVRKLTIGDEQWRYTVGRQDIVIWSPLKKRYHIGIYNLLTKLYEDTSWRDCEDRYENRCLHVTPSDIRQYIEMLV